MHSFILLHKIEAQVSSIKKKEGTSVQKMTQQNSEFGIHIFRSHQLPLCKPETENIAYVRVSHTSVLDRCTHKPCLSLVMHI